MEKIEKFNNEGMQLMHDIAGLDKVIKKVNEQNKEMRAQLLKLCEKYGIDSIDNEYLKISKVKESESLSVDLKLIEKSEIDLYNSLLENYPIKTVRKSHIRIKVK